MADDTTKAVSASGIEQCLQMLAQEAVSIGMVRTAFILQEALEVCRDEAVSHRLRLDDAADAIVVKHALMN